MANLAITGHATRGKEVIEILEMLGGKQEYEICTGSDIGYYWYIKDNGFITCNYSAYKNDCVEYTLEEFLKKFPYKVGDKVAVTHPDDSTGILIDEISSMKWNGNEILYGIDDLEFSAEEIQPYKEETINIAELLKYCPKGMELDCTMSDGIQFDKINTWNEIYPIIIRRADGAVFSLTKYGQYIKSDYSKCVIFPKGKTTWEGFVPPCQFKDGDVISNLFGTCIFKGEGRIKGTVDYYCGVVHPDYFNVKDKKFNPDKHYGNIVDYRFATEEEKQKLFDAIKANGYKWNEEEKKLEKLEVKKFDINTLVPFESKVLVRDGLSSKWLPAIWGFYNEDGCDYHYEVVGGNSFSYCIPYEGNEHLRGTTDDCAESYKTWEV